MGAKYIGTVWAARRGEPRWTFGSRLKLIVGCMLLGTAFSVALHVGDVSRCAAARSHGVAPDARKGDR